MPAPAPSGAAATERSTPDSAFEASALERSLNHHLPTRWIGGRRRLLVLAALLGCLGLFGLARWLASTPYLDLALSADSRGALVLTGSGLPALDALAGRTLVAASPAGLDQREPGPRLLLDALLLHRSPRWQVNDGLRERQLAQHTELAELLARGPVRLQFGDGAVLELPVPARGYAGLGWLFWPLAGLALALYLLAVVVVLARPQPRNLLFLLMAWSQAGQLVLVAIEALPGVGGPALLPAAALPWRLALDAVTAAAAVHAFALHPHRLPRAACIAGAAWAVAVVWLALVYWGPPPGLWWWAQAQGAALCAAALLVITRSYRLEPNPFTAVIRRLAIVALATLLLLSAAVAGAAHWPAAVRGAYGVAGAAGAAAVLLPLFLSVLLLLAPFVARSRQVLREFAMLAGISTVATSLDLVFVAVFSLGPFAALTLAVFVALGVYAAARQWVMNRLSGRSVLTTERTFEQLYRVAREVQARPARYPELLGQLLRDLFEPLEVLRVPRSAAHARVVGGGSALVVPMRGSGSGAAPPAGAAVPAVLVLRFARHGQRLFNDEDARLADRVVEQLRRAVAYDKAVERGRTEERLRIAQDLHDDIGARLLTLMYQAQSPEMEDYIRHTLQDLKTLTRGLAAAEHPLSHAAAEWKADLTQRLTAARVDLSWSFGFDRDLRLSMTQWSALTRMLRELVSNALYHAQAARVEVSVSLAGPLLVLRVADDGRGRAPQDWSHGLGLGGVRKRARLLGGEVAWRENQPRGIVCEVRLPDFSERG